MLVAFKNTVASLRPRWLALATVGLACCLISLGTFDTSISSFSDADFFGVRISEDPLDGGLPIIAVCLVFAVFACRAKAEMRPTVWTCAILAATSLVGIVGLFMGSDGVLPHALAEVGGTLLTVSALTSLALWVQHLARQGVGRMLVVLALAFVLETFAGLFVGSALVPGAAKITLVLVVAASPAILAFLARTSESRRQAGASAGTSAHSLQDTAGLSATDAVRSLPARSPKGEQPGAGCGYGEAVYAHAGDEIPAVPLAVSLACIAVWGFLMGRVQAVGNSLEDSQGFMAFLLDNAVALSALATAVLCFALIGRRHAFGVTRITVLAMLACSLYFSGTFGPVSIPVGMIAMGAARMAAFVYMWMLACHFAVRPDSSPAGANGPAFALTAGWGLFTLANTASTKIGLFVPAGGTAFLVYNVAIMACLVALIVVELLPRRLLVDAGAVATEEAAPLGTPDAVDPAAVRCAELAARLGLTEREREVFVPLVRGRSAASIASQLSMSTETARTHIRHIYQKAEVHSREELMDLVDGE